MDEEDYNSIGIELKKNLIDLVIRISNIEDEIRYIKEKMEENLNDGN